MGTLVFTGGIGENAPAIRRRIGGALAQPKLIEYFKQLGITAGDRIKVEGRSRVVLRHYPDTVMIREEHL